MDERNEMMSLLSFGANNEKSYGTVTDRGYLGSALKSITSFQEYEVQPGKKKIIRHHKYLNEYIWK